MLEYKPYVNAIRLSKVVAPVPDSYPVAEGDLSIDIDFSLKMKVAQGQHYTTGWVFDSTINNKLKILVFQVTSRIEHNFLTDMNYRAPGQLQNLLWNSYLSNKFAYKVVTWSGPGDQGLSLLQNNEQVGTSVVYDIPFRLSDNGDQFVINSDLNHISYFFLPYVDETPGIIPTFVGGVTIKEVIYNSALTKTGLIFTLPNGDTWKENVQLDFEGHFMTHDPSSNEMHLLTTTETRNTVVQDLRTFDAFKQRIGSIDFAISGIESPSNQVYLSDFLVSRDSNKNNRFFFALDALKAVKDGSAFSSLFTNPVAANALTPLAAIKDLKVFRRNVHLEEDKELIVNSSDTGGVLGQTSYVIETEETPEESAILGAIKETYGRASLHGIRTFTGTDYDIVKHTGGVFEYSVEIEILDPTVEYMKSRKEELLQAQATLVDYYNQFLLNTRSKMKLSYGSAQQKEALMTAINSFLDFLSFMTSQSNSANQVLDIYDIIGPYTGSIKGIELFLDAFSALLVKLEVILGTVSSGSTNTSTNQGEQQTQNSSSPAPRTITITKNFANQRFNAKLNQVFGYNFIEQEDADNSEGVGLMTIDVSYYQNRVAEERSKYFSAVGAASEMPYTTPTGGKLNLNLDTTNMQFLTPIAMKLNDTFQRIINTSKSDFNNTAIYNEILSEIIKYNLNLAYTERADVYNSLSEGLLEIAAYMGIALPPPKTAVPEKLGEDILDAMSKEEIHNYKNAWKEYKQQEAGINKPTVPVDELFSIIISTVLANIYGNINLQSYDLNNNTSSFRRIEQEAFSPLSNQTKALILYATAADPAAHTHINFIYDMTPNNFGWFYQSFLNLVRIEVLVYYSASQGGQGEMRPNVGSPMFVPLTAESLAQAAVGRPDNKVLCRMVRHHCTGENILDDPNLTFPTLNQYFLLDTAQTAEIPLQGETSMDAGHKHVYEVDELGNGVAQMVFHPETNKIHHQHIITGHAVGIAQSTCYPGCKELYGYDGVAPHVHNLVATATQEPQIDAINFNNLTYLDISQQAINTSEAYRTFKQNPAAIKTSITDATQTMFINQISSAVWEEMSTGGGGGGY